MIIQPDDRNQVILFTNLDDYIDKNNPVRFIDATVNIVLAKLQNKVNNANNSKILNNTDNFANLELLELKFKGTSHTGRPAYPSDILLKLFIYGCINRITSSRRLELETHRNLELRWLLGNLTPDHKTIANFRKDNSELIHSFSKELRLLLKEMGLVNTDKMIIDGTKLKANATKHSYTKADLEKSLSKLENYLSELQSNDENEEQTELINTKLEERQKELARINRKIAKRKKALAEFDKDKKLKYINLTDTDARRMKSRDGNINAFNAQFVTDGNYKFILADLVVNEVNDVEQLKPMVEQTSRELETQFKESIEDHGYYSPDAIEQVEESGTDCYVPVPKDSKTKSLIVFEFDEANNRYICPEGKYLNIISRNIKKNKSFVDVYQCKECDGCGLRTMCTKSKKGRIINRYINQEFRDNYKIKMQSEASKERMKGRRKIEKFFGTMKIWLGKIPILTRGKPKVSTEVKIFCISYNIKSLSGLLSLEELQGQLLNNVS
jgi:transposase